MKKVAFRRGRYYPDFHDNERNRNQISLPKGTTKKAAKETDILIIPGTELTRFMPPGHFNAIFVKDVNTLNQKDLYDGALISLGTHPILGCWSQLGRQVILGRFDKIAQPRPRFTRIDDILHPKGFGGPERRFIGTNLGLDFRPSFVRIVAAFDFAFESRRHPTFDGNGSELGRRPGNPIAQSVIDII
mgnify:CR=1 FL=1